jgi:protein SCO1/2
MRLRLHLFAFFCLFALANGGGRVLAQSAPVRPEIPVGTVPDEIPGVGVRERFDTSVPMDAELYDHEGRRVRLGDFFHERRPVVLLLVYHQCASFCDMLLRSVGESLAQQPWTIGVEYEVVTLSVDPRDTAQVLRDARARTLGRYGREEAQQGWHFVRGTESQIRRITDSVGYDFQWDERTQQFAHPGVTLILQPEGRVSRYLYGLEVPFNDVRLALYEASEGGHLPTPERIIRASLLYCFRWDHADGRYVIAAWRIMRVGGVLTVILLGGFLFSFWRRERRRMPSTSSVSLDSGSVEPRAPRAGES